MTDTNTTLGERLHLARRRAGKSAGEMAMTLRRAPNTISSWETDRAEPGYADLVMWAAACGEHGEVLAADLTDHEEGVA